MLHVLPCYCTAYGHSNLLVLPQNISSTAVAAGLSGVAGALTRANLVEALDTAKDLTVFVSHMPCLTDSI